MSRASVAADRTGTLVLGLVLAVLGVAAGAWFVVGQGWVPRVPGVPGRLSTAGLDTVATMTWWPWALGAAGVVLVLLGLRWAASHLPDRGVSRLRLTGSGGQGRLEVETGTAADAAADALGRCEGVRSAHGRIVREHGQLVADLRATVERGADLHAVCAAADQVSSDLARVLGRDDVRCSIRLHVARRDRSLPRVR